jgi:predicted membrane chloride channel (bestrophin family)
MTRSNQNPKLKPKRPVARTISCRVDDELHAALQQYCDENHLAPSEGFRKLLCQQLMPAKARARSKTEQERYLLPQLHAMAQACEIMARTLTQAAKRGDIDDRLVRQLIDRLDHMTDLMMQGGKL